MKKKSVNPKQREALYEELIDMPRHVSGHRAPMPRAARAAQFAPFAALTGFSELIEKAEAESDLLSEKNYKKPSI